jgi:YD repeat-containing protein
MSWTSTGQNEFWILLSVSNAATFTGTGANGVYIWGAQAVEGSTALPYQKTETRLNIPRLDYSNGTCPSLLVEPQRTNDGVLINASDFIESGHRYTTLMVASSTTTAQVRIGNGTGGPTTATVVLSMPQLELGNYGTSYIPTTSASVTRNADVISKTGISSLIGQTEGTLFVEIFADGIATSARGIMYVSDGTTGNRVAIQYDASGNLQAIASSGGTTQGWVIYGYSGNAKIAFAYNATNYELFVKSSSPLADPPNK